MDDERNLQDFAKRLYELRQRKGPSARDMSLSLGFAPNYMHGLESAKNYPAMKAFFYICDFFGVSPMQFFDYEDENPELTDKLYREIRKLDASSKEYVLTLIEGINKRPK